MWFWKCRVCLLWGVLFCFVFWSCLSCLQAVIFVFRWYSFQHTPSVPQWKWYDKYFENYRKNKGNLTRFGWHKALLDPTWPRKRDFPHWIMWLWRWSCSFPQKFYPVSFPQLVRNKTFVSGMQLRSLILPFIGSVHNMRSIKSNANYLWL